MPLMVWFFIFLFWFCRRRGGFDLEIQSHKLDFSSTTFSQKDENNFGGPQSRMNTGSAGVTEKNLFCHGGRKMSVTQTNLSQGST
jgi:hypothetical protein